MLHKKNILTKSEILNIAREITRQKIEEKKEVDVNNQTKLPKRKKKRFDLADVVICYVLIHSLLCTLICLMWTTLSLNFDGSTGMRRNLDIGYASK